METIIKDDKDRDIIIIRNNGQMVIARFPDMQQSIKDYIISLYKDSTDEDETKSISPGTGDETLFKIACDKR